MPLADDVLQHLFGRGDRARVAGSQRTVRETFKDVKNAYWEQSIDQRDAMHAALQRAAAAGAVTLTWGKHGGDDRPLAAVALRDLDALGKFLGRTTGDVAAASAAATLAPWREANPRVVEILTAWGQLKKVRGLGPETASDFADALRLLDAVAGATEDRVARPLSVEVFGNSKRIEALYVHLDVLTAESRSAPARHWSEVLAAIGVRKEPQPFLVAGGGELILARGPNVPVAEPFVGVASHALTAFRGAPAWLLTIENLTTFHQAAEMLAGSPRGLVLFTGGMPSPSWMRAYSNILDGLAETTTLLHWGDHDEGGFRIAARLASHCAARGKVLLPWNMDASQFAKRPRSSEAQQAAMAASARRAGWNELASKLPAVLLEQEGQRVTLPG